MHATSNVDDVEPSKTAGRLHAAKGHFVEDLGNFLGNEKMEAKGREERVEGKIEVQAAKEEEAAAAQQDPQACGAAKNVNDPASYGMGV